MTKLRQYETAPDHVREHYRRMRIHQTLTYNRRARERPLEHKLTIREAMDLLGQCRDASDPDVDGSNLMHAYQTAERMRVAGEPEWMQFAGLIHDLGKIRMLFSEEDGQSMQVQWGISGDTWAVGCRLPDCLVYPEFNDLNPDNSDSHSIYSEEMGVYCAGCGIRKLMFTWGHDEYMYRVLLQKRYDMFVNGQDFPLPQKALDCIRLHSAYPWHEGGAYSWAEIPSDRPLKSLVRRFNSYDLYSKEDEMCDIELLKPYYEALMDKYLPGEIAF
jgi:inositol oxygenase